MRTSDGNLYWSDGTTWVSVAPSSGDLRALRFAHRALQAANAQTAQTIVAEPIKPASATIATGDLLGFFDISDGNGWRVDTAAHLHDLEPTIRKSAAKTYAARSFA
jgi:hypothetical protein